MGKATTISKEEIEKIIYNYSVLRKSQKEAGKEFGYSYKVVQKILKENDVRIRSQSEARQKFQVNHNYFKNQSKNMAYLLGLLASDGCVASNKNLIYIELQRQDKELLEKINKEISNDRAVQDYTTSRGYENSKLYFYSKEIKDDLKKYKIIPNKTYSKEFGFPELLKEEYYIDYIRGLFDGDGCIKDSNHTPTWEINSCNEEIINKIQVYFQKIGINMKSYTFSKDKNIPMYRIYVYGKANCEKIYNLLYRDSDLFLERKKSKFLNLLK